MKCPKCEHDQAGTVECAKCGIIFERYLKRQERLVKEQEQAAVPPAEVPPASGRNSATGWLVAGGLLLLMAGSWGYNFFIHPSPSQSPTAAGPVAADLRVVPVPATVSPRRGIVGDKAPIAQIVPTDSAIDHARKATVFIRTPWGSGSGVFVSDVGHIVTNRHVVEFDTATLKGLQEKAASLDKQLELERKNIRYFKGRLSRVPSELHEQAENSIRQRQESYEKYRQLSVEVHRKLKSIEQASWVSDVEVVLFDGSKYQVQALEISKKTDLALLSVDCINSPFLKPAANSLGMDYGQKVYTIGNPSGLRDTVTSGIISGYRQYKGNPYIQTDAAINPGNSGGPLVDKDGRLLGINTMILRNTEGIGFAIPFKTVREEFGAYLP